MDSEVSLAAVVAIITTIITDIITEIIIATEIIAEVLETRIAETRVIRIPRTAVDSETAVVIRPHKETQTPIVADSEIRKATAATDLNLQVAAVSGADLPVLKTADQVTQIIRQDPIVVVLDKTIINKETNS